jgi:hypothetical protein
MAKKPPPLPEGFELESSGPANSVPQLPEGFELEGAANTPQQEPTQGDQPKGMIAAGLAGVGRGIAGMPGIVGDIQALARKAEPYLGIKTPKNPWIQAPTSEQMIENAAEYVPGIKYQPQTTGEKYAASVGSFLPGALMGGGGMVRNALAFGVAPGLASEAAGQMTEGTAAEPYARVAGGLVGGMVGPALSNVPGRIMSPIRQAEDVAEHVARAEGAGVKSLTAGQKTGSRAVKWVEGTAMDSPFTGRNAERVAKEQGEDIARAMSRETGYESSKLGAEEFANILGKGGKLGQEYDVLHGRNTLNMDQQFLGDVGSANAEVMRRMSGKTPSTVQAYLDEIARGRKRGGTLAGDVYQDLRGRIGEDARLAATPAEQEALISLKRSLDSAMSRSMSPEDYKDLMDLNRRYSNAKVLEAAAARRGENIARGYVEPSAVSSEVSNRNKAAFVRGRSDLGNLSRSLEAIGMKLPQSGTQPRTMAQNILNLGGALGPAAAGATFGGIPGAIAGLAVPHVMSNVVMSRPIQGWLANQNATRLGLLADVGRARRVRGLLGGGVSGAAGQRSR